MADDDLDILAWTMLGEAGGQGPQGMSDVAHVILNRLNAGNYGSSIQDVALSPKQFSTWNSGSGGNDPKGKYPKDSPEFQRARQLAEQVIGGQIPGPPGRPLDYNADNITPYWASSKDNNGTYTRNGHTFYPSVPIPPSELPEVGTLTDTVPSRVTPVTPSPQMNTLRSPPPLPPARPATPGGYAPDFIEKSMAALPKSAPSGLGDQIGMSPIQGGTQQAPLFDAGYDERMGAMRLMPEALDTQGMFTARSPSPPRLLPPIPPSTLGQPANLTGLYAGGGPTRPPTDQVGIAPTGRPMLDNGDGSVSTELSITVTDPRLNNGQPTNIPTIWGGRRLSDEQAINSARASGQNFTAFPSIAAAERAAEYRSANEILPQTGVGQPPATRTVQSVPVTPRPAAPGQTYTGQDRSPPPALPSPITARPGVTRTASLAGEVALPPGVRPQIPSTAPPLVQTEAQRLAALYANGGPTRPFVQMPNQQQVADATGFRVPQGAQFTYDPTASQPTDRLPSLLPPDPTPVLPPTPSRYRPIPFDRPSFMTAAMPPMPPSRPIPLQRPAQQAPARAPLRITVNGANPLPAPAAPRLSPAQAYEMANQAAAQRARDRAGNTTERSDYFKMATGG